MTKNSTIFATDLVLPEGPVALPYGSWLVVDLAPERGCVIHISNLLSAREGRGTYRHRDRDVDTERSLARPSLLQFDYFFVGHAYGEVDVHKPPLPFFLAHYAR
jgi:hypothetical protein